MGLKNRPANARAFSFPNLRKGPGIEVGLALKKCLAFWLFYRVTKTVNAVDTFTLS